MLLLGSKEANFEEGAATTFPENFIKNNDKTAHNSLYIMIASTTYVLDVVISPLT